MTVKLQSVFPVPRRRNVNERLHCIGCQAPLSPRNKSSDANFCRSCFSKLQSSFKQTLYYPVEKSVFKVKTETIVKTETVRIPYDSHEDLTRELTQTRDRAVDLAINNNQRAGRLEDLLAQRDTVIDRLTHENKRLKKHGKP